MVQFGHNDATMGVDDRYASPADYKEYLRTYVNGTRQRGATPVLVTPVGRRDFDEATGKFNVSFPEYVDKMKELAAEENVALVDLSALEPRILRRNRPGGHQIRLPPRGSRGLPQPARPERSTTPTSRNTGPSRWHACMAGGVKQLDIPLAARAKEIVPPSAVPAKPPGPRGRQHLERRCAAQVAAHRGRGHLQGVPEAGVRTGQRLQARPQRQPSPLPTLRAWLEGTAYGVRIAAMNGKGLSGPATPCALTTKASASTSSTSARRRPR